MNQVEPMISVVIPVRNSVAIIGRCLDSLLKVDHPSFEVLVLDDGSTDATPEVCQSYSAFRVVLLEQGGPSRARNIGIKLAAGEFVAFTDGDCIVDQGWLRGLQEGFLSPEVGGVGGDQRSPDDETGTGRLIHDFLKLVGFIGSYMKSGSAMTETDHNPTCNAMYRKSVLVEAGGFDESLWPGEDVELDFRIKRLGYKLIYNPAACVAHYRPSSYRGFTRMLRRYGEAQGWLVRRYGLFRTIHFVPVALVAAIVALAVLSTMNPWLALAFFLPWPLVWGWLCLRGSSPIKSLRFSWLLVMTLASWNIGFLKGIVEDKPRRYGFPGACAPPGRER